MGLFPFLPPSLFLDLMSVVPNKSRVLLPHIDIRLFFQLESQLFRQANPPLTALV